MASTDGERIARLEEQVRSIKEAEAQIALVLADQGKVMNEVKTKIEVLSWKVGVIIGSIIFLADKAWESFVG